MRTIHKGFGCCDRTDILEDLFRTLAFCCVFGMGGDQNLSAVHFIVIPQRFKFRYFQADHRPGQPSYYCATASACECSNDGSPRNQKTEPTNRQCTDTHQPT